jgi:hypothetical protein
MPEQFSIKYEFTEAMAARAADSYIRAHIKGLDAKFWTALGVLVLWVTICALVLLLGILLSMPWWILLIPIGLLAIFGGMLLLLLSLHLFVVVVRPLARWGTRRKMMAGYRDLADRTIHWAFADHQFAVRSAISDRAVPWRELRQLRLYPDFWALGLKNGPDLMLPVEVLSPEVQRLIRAKAREAGVAVLTDDDRTAA